MISTRIIADSLSPQGDRLTSLLITFPRIILAEVNTHRMLSKNTSSSRAIPFNKMVEAVQNDPFIPIAWQKEHKGMQGNDYFTEEKEIKSKTNAWLAARDNAIQSAKFLNSNLVVHEIGGEDFISYNQFDEDSLEGLRAKERLENTKVTKQLCNRLLEPFMWTTMLITGSKEGWDNFFHLRCPDYQYLSSYGTQHYKSKKEFLRGVGLPDSPENYKNYTDLDWLKINKGQAEIHIMDLAEKMYDAYNESTPKKLAPGDYHIPFSEDINFIELTTGLSLEDKIKVSIGMCARVSYIPFGDESTLKVETYLNIYDKMFNARPFHASPFEHIARAMSDEEYNSNIKGYVSYEGSTIEEESIYIPSKQSKGWCRNFKGFIQERHRLEELWKVS